MRALEIDKTIPIFVVLSTEPQHCRTNIVLTFLRANGRFPFNKNHQLKLSEFSLVEWNASDRIPEFVVTCCATQGMLVGLCCALKWRLFKHLGGVRTR